VPFTAEAPNDASALHVSALHVSALRDIACQCADAQMAAGADAVVLVGSVAVGLARPRSDIDLVVLTGHPEDVAHQLVRSGRVVNVDATTEAEVRRAFAAIPDALAVVPGWQHADILADPHGIARRIATEAAAWSFDDRVDDIGRWAAAKVTGLAEEVQKTRNVASAAARTVNATLVVLQLSGPMTALAGRHHRSENELWDLAAEVMGPDWRRARDRVLGLSGPADPAAALALYELAVPQVEEWLTTAQRQVVDLAMSAHE
jgi:predicted nucleotidyltransferase